MNNIKFKAWDIKKNMWVNDFLIDPDNGDLLCSGYLDLNLNDDLELMQYTGLKDKDGKEIYEGDVLRWYPNRPVNHIDVIICWDEHTASFSFGAWYDHEFPDPSEDSLVIGNIYDNPEPLEKCS